MQGILLVNKPIGWTSFDVVAIIRKIIAKEQKVKPSLVKVGHAGTLDPLATGLLIILIGKKYTKLAANFTKLNKEYIFEMKLGETTASADRETKPQFYSNYRPSKAEIEQVLKSLIGKMMQQPPIFSAVKINGQRAYKLARAGQDFDLKKRPITIYNLELISYKYPMLKLNTVVSSGTYIRALVTDIGDQLKTGGYMTTLVRTKIGDLNLSDSQSPVSLSYSQLNSHLIQVDSQSLL